MSDAQISGPLTPPGLSADRLRPDRTNRREVAFAEQWTQEHSYGDVLQALFRVPCYSDDPDRIFVWREDYPIKMPLGEPTERDRIVAATVIQWLGSNVGMSFMHEALKRVGGQVRWPSQEGEPHDATL